jgi:hypothetical protein
LLAISSCTDLKLFQLKKVSLIILFMSIVHLSSIAQKVTGEWYGVGKVNRAGDYNNYLAEMILTQTGNKVTGEFNYFFKQDKITTTVTGTFDAKTRTLELRAHPILNYKAKNINGADCTMEGSFTLITSKVETVLRGQFNPSLQYRYTCPAINIKFVKEVVKRNDEDRMKVAEVNEGIKALQEAAMGNLEAEPDPIVKKAVEELNKRVFDVVEEIEIESDSVSVSLYDNGEVDFDTVSIFYDKNLVLAKNMLSDKPIAFKLGVDSIHEVSMYAENLGQLPPNTALLIVMDGDKRHEIRLVSNFIKNSTIRLRKKGLPPTNQ